MEPDIPVFIANFPAWHLPHTGWYCRKSCQHSVGLLPAREADGIISQGPRVKSCPCLVSLSKRRVRRNDTGSWGTDGGVVIGKIQTVSTKLSRRCYLLASRPLHLVSLSSQGPFDWRTSTKRQRGTTSKTGNYRLQLVDVMLTAR